MPSLQDLKALIPGLTNKKIGDALGCSEGKAGQIIRGLHINVYYDEDIQQLAAILRCTFERCWYAMCESYNQWRIANGMTPMEQIERPSVLRQRVQEAMNRSPRFPTVPVDPVRPMTEVESFIDVRLLQEPAQTA